MKVLVVLENLSAVDRLQLVMRMNKNELKDEYVFDYLERDFDEILRKRKDYHNSMFVNLDKIQNMITPEDGIPEVDVILFGVNDSDPVMRAVAKKYMEKYSISNEHVYFAWTYSSYRLAYCDFIRSSHWTLFKEIYREDDMDALAEHMQKVCNVKDLRDAANMNRTEFAKYFDIPYRTVENWENGTNRCPNYLYNLMYYKLSHEQRFVQSVVETKIDSGEKYYDINARLLDPSYLL